MPTPISEQHALRKLFEILTEKNFYERLGWPDAHVIKYITDLLVDFIHIENVYRIKSSSGKQLREIAQMLLEGESQSRVGAREREREIHRHIGDYALFMMGIFPEYLKHLKCASSSALGGLGGGLGLISHPDVLMDYVKVGKRSYRIVSEFTSGSFREIAPLFRKLSEHFELCVIGLAYIRHDMDRLRLPNPARTRKILLN
jgi:hypothetical protein